MSSFRLASVRRRRRRSRGENPGTERLPRVVGPSGSRDGDMTKSPRELGSLEKLAEPAEKRTRSDDRRTVPDRSRLEPHSARRRLAAGPARPTGRPIPARGIRRASADSRSPPAAAGDERGPGRAIAENPRSPRSLADGPDRPGHPRPRPAAERPASGGRSPSGPAGRPTAFRGLTRGTGRPAAPAGTVEARSSAIVALDRRAEVQPRFLQLGSRGNHPLPDRVGFLMRGRYRRSPSRCGASRSLTILSPASRPTGSCSGEGTAASRRPSTA